VLSLNYDNYNAPNYFSNSPNASIEYIRIIKRNSDGKEFLGGGIGRYSFDRGDEWRFGPKVSIGLITRAISNTFEINFPIGKYPYITYRTGLGFNIRRFQRTKKQKLRSNDMMIGSKPFRNMNASIT